MNPFARPRSLVAAALAGLVAPAIGCSKPSPASTEPSAAASASAPSASAKRTPAPKETKVTEDAKLGTLPEGVGIAAGSPAIDAALRDASGKTVQLADLWRNGWVLLVFYRGGWCPFCNFQVRELVRARPELDKRGVTPVLISVDRVSEAAKTSASYDISYPVLSDPELVAHRGFRVLQQVDDATLQKYREFGIDLEASSGQKHHTIAVPSLFLVDKSGVVRFAHADRDYKVRPSIAQILAAIDRTLRAGD